VLAFAGAGVRRAPVKFFPPNELEQARSWLAEWVSLNMNCGAAGDGRFGLCNSLKISDLKSVSAASAEENKIMEFRQESQLGL
jgi:hypothetical protein